MDKESDVPIIINLTLFKYNYYDNKLISLIKHNSLYLHKHNYNKFTVSTWDIKKILSENFSKYIDDINNSTLSEFPKKVNSIYFINEIIKIYINLKYIIINISNDKECSRLIYDNTSKNPIINFDFKIISIILDLPNHLNDIDLKTFNEILIGSKLMKRDLYRNGSPYIYTTVSDFYEKTDDFFLLFEKNSETLEKYNLLLPEIENLLNSKIQQDNPTCLLITDYSN